MKAGECFGSYEIVSSLGSGGMGEVYRAKDLRLGREVAVKVLSRSLRQDPQSLARFEREARALASLNHPHVAVLYGIEKSGDERLLVMELVRGETLDRHLARDSIPMEEAVRLAMQIADALEAAHRNGIVHRDLKPANVMVGPRGDIKLLDFGLSKLLDAEPSPEDATIERNSRLSTRAGAVMGTAPYMSPEQAAGKRVDARTDIWSFGCLLYEMLTATRPFGGGSFAETASEIFTKDPEWSRLPPETPDTVRRLLRRCLQKDVHDRLQSIGDARIELRELLEELTAKSPTSSPSTPAAVTVGASDRFARNRTRFAVTFALALLTLIVIVVLLMARSTRIPLTPPGRPEIRSIAVLPLASHSPDPGDDYFVDGMTEALINDLAALRLWKVISRTSVMRYKERTGPLPPIARELGADAVVEGSVLRAGERVRITARLIDGATEQNLWTGAYERELKDIVALQGDVARAIAMELRGSLAPEVAGRLATGGEVDPETHLLYLKGRFLWNERTSSSLEQAIRHFERALERDPAYAPAHSGLAESYLLLAGPGSGTWRPGIAFPLSKAAARRAIELDDSLAGSHAALGYTALLWEWDWQTSEREFRRAIELNPSYANAHFWYAAGLASRGRIEEAIQQAKKAVELDPVSPIITAGLAWVYHFAGDHDAVIAVTGPALDLNPNFPILHYRIGAAYRHKRLYGRAIEHLERAVELSPDSPDMLAQLALTLGSAGRMDEARSILAKIDSMAQTQYVSAHSRALIHLGLGEREAALGWLEKGLEERSWPLPFIGVDADFRELHHEPRFQRVLQTMGAPGADISNDGAIGTER